jgi:hypothetical protein
VQNKPFDVEHSEVPQVHAFVFSTLPSTLVQLGWLEQ